MLRLTRALVVAASFLLGTGAFAQGLTGSWQARSGELFQIQQTSNDALVGTLDTGRFYHRFEASRIDAYRFGGEFDRWDRQAGNCLARLYAVFTLNNDGTVNFDLYNNAAVQQCDLPPGFHSGYYPLYRVGPTPPPPVSPCQGLEGAYRGICRAPNGAGSAISFLVQDYGAYCVVTNSQYFQNAYLGVGGGRGDANVTQIPGGVAISNTHVTVWGAGRFYITGYNYAGRFNFVCQ